MEMKKYKLGELCDFNKSSISKSECFTQIEYLDTSSITENQIFGTQLLNIEKAPSRAQRKVKNNTIVYSTVRPNLKHFGILKNPSENFIVSTGFATIDVKDKFKDVLDADFLFLFLSQNYLSNYLQGIAQNSVSAYPSLNPSDIANLTIHLPSLPTQQRIAKVLTDIDNKIALNKKINKELEAMAKELYDYWFVQFDFPGADGKPYKSSGGKMVYNEVLKREIPEGWEVKRLGEYAEVKKGNLITEKDSKSGNIKVVAAGVDFSYLTDTPNRNKNVLTVSGSGANAGYINFWREPIFASDCTTIQFEKDINTILCHYGMNFYQEYLMTNASGSAQPHVYPKQVAELPYILLPESLVNIVEKEFVSINSQISIFEQEIQHLTALRDELLPLLMNGQVSVK